MKAILIMIVFLVLGIGSYAQQVLLMDRFDGNKVVNGTTISAFSTDTNITDLTKYFTIKNNTDRPLALYMRKTVNVMADSTSDYFCFSVKCWPDDDTAYIADSIAPGAESFNFASHVTHIRRFDIPPLPPGTTSITYTLYDHEAFPEPVEASVTVIYQLSPVGVDEPWQEAVAVYPNPASDRITVRTKESMPREAALFLYNGLGMLAKQPTYHLSGNTLTFPVDRLSAGVYFGKLVAGNGKQMTFRFQVTR